jgi:hypothetical protein
MDHNKFYVYLVEVDKRVGIKAAKRLSNGLLQAKKCKPYGESDTHYKFKNIPRKYFDPETFKRHTFSTVANIVYGQLKSNAMNIEHDEPPGSPQKTATDDTD